MSDYLAPTANMRVRFSIADSAFDTVTEGGVDNFVAETFCAQPAALATFFNGSGANTACFNANAPVLGQPWVATVAHTTMPDAP